MKILLLIPDLGIGGAQKQFTETAIHLLREEEVRLCIVSINGNSEYLTNNNRNIKVIHLRKRAGSLSLIFAFICYILLLYKFKPDVVHAWLGRAHKFAFFGKIFYRSKIVFGFRNTAKGDYRPLSKVDFYFWSRLLVNFYVSNSLIQKDFLRVKYSIKRNSVFLPNGYSIRSSMRTFASLDNKDSKKTILLPSRICEQKNQLELLEYLVININILKHFNFRFVGPVYDKNYHNRIIEFLQSHKVLSESVSIITNCNNISSEYENSDVVMLNSKFEGFSNVILEAWDFSRLLIVSTASDPNRLIKSDYNGFSFESYDHLSSQFNKILNLSDKVVTSLIVNGRNSLSRYSFDIIARKYMGIYRNLGE